MFNKFLKIGVILLVIFSTLSCVYVYAELAGNDNLIFTENGKVIYNESK